MRDVCQRNPTWSPLKCWPPPPPKHHRGGRKQRISSSGEADGATLEKILSSRIPKNVLKKKTTRKQDLPDGEPTYGPQTEFYACFARGRREQRKIKVSFTTTTSRAEMVLLLLWPQNLPPPPVLTLTLVLLLLLLPRRQTSSSQES